METQFNKPIPDLEVYIKRLNSYIAEHYPASKVLTAEEWNALFLAVIGQGNAQEETLAKICNEYLPLIIRTVNNKQPTLIAGDNIIIEGNVISAKALSVLVDADSELSTESEKPVQNRVITKALAGKQNTLTPGENVKIEDDTISVTVDLSQFKSYENGAIRIGTPDPLDNVAPNSTAIGNVTKATQEYATAICPKALAYAIKSTSMGYDARVMPSSDFGTSIGSGSRCYSRGGTTIGVNASTGESGGVPATNSYATSIGANAKATKHRGGAFGAWAQSTAMYADAFGANALVTSEKTIQLGADNLSALNCSVNLTITSDKRDKIDIENIDKCLEFINKLTPVTYVSNRRVDYIPEENKHAEYDEAGNEIPNVEYSKYKQYGMADYDLDAYKRGDKKGTRRRSGLLAQDVQEAIKEVYGTDNYANIVDDNFYDLENKPIGIENKLTLAYSNLIPFLIGAIKELKSKVDKLEQLITQIN